MSAATNQILDNHNVPPQPFSRMEMIAPSLVIFLFMAQSLSSHGFSGDGLMDINIGQWILQHGRVPLHNYFTQALYGAPWTDSEWGFAVYVAVAWHLGGRLAVFLSLTPFLAATSLLLGTWLRQLGPALSLIFSTIVGLGLIPIMAPRPQLFSYAAFAFGLWAIQKARHHLWRPLLAFLLIIPLWTNIHASVVLAPALLLNETLFAKKTTRLRLLLATIIATMLMWIRPNGGQGVGQFIRHVALNPALTSVISEWKSPNFHTSIGWVFLPFLMLSWAFILPRAVNRKQWADAVWMVLGPLVTLWAARFGPYMIIGVVALIPAYWPRPFEKTRRQWRFGARAILIASFALTGVWTYSNLTPKFFARNYPVATERFLKQHHAQNVVTFYNWGDSLQFNGIRPWTNGQAQLWAKTPWWTPFITANAYTIVPWARQWDPRSHWIMWPINGHGSSQQLIHASGWHLVFREQLKHGTVGLWEKTAGKTPSRPSAPSSI